MIRPSCRPVKAVGAGWARKTYRVLETLRDVYPRTQGICDASEITADTVLIEPLRFTLPTESYGDREYESVETLIHELQNHKSRKILYCSELTLMRMPHFLREQVLGLSDLATANCKFQANVFKYANVHTNHIGIVRSRHRELQVPGECVQVRERAYESHFVRSGESWLQPSSIPPS